MTALLIAELGLAVLGLAACSAPEPAQSAGGQSSSPADVQASTAPTQASDPTLVANPVEGVPFELMTPTGGVASVQVHRAQDSTPAVLGEDFETLGETAMQGSMPGPIPRVLLDDGSAFGSLMRRVGEDDITSFEDIPSIPGIIATDGSFTPLDTLAGPMKSLPGSNPDNLYFEPQHATANGPWVVWREGSAGQEGALPTLDSDDWRLVAWNRDTGAVSELASAFLAHGNRFAPYASWDVAPSTDGTLVYFEATMPGPGDTWDRSIISAPLDGSGTVSILDRGIMPVANPTGGAFWVSQDQNDSGIVVRDGRPLFSIAGAGWSIARLAGSDTILVATVAGGSSAWLVVFDLATNQITDVIDTGSDWAEVSVSEREFVWGNNSGSGDPMMYRMGADGQLTSLWGVQGLSAPLINGDTLVVPTEIDGGAVVWSFLRWI